MQIFCEKRKVSSTLPEAIAPSRGVTVYVVLFERYWSMGEHPSAAHRPMKYHGCTSIITLKPGAGAGIGAHFAVLFSGYYQICAVCGILRYTHISSIEHVTCNHCTLFIGYVALSVQSWHPVGCYALRNRPCHSVAPRGPGVPYSSADRSNGCCE